MQVELKSGRSDLTGASKEEGRAIPFHQLCTRLAGLVELAYIQIKRLLGFTICSAVPELARGLCLNVLHQRLDVLYIGYVRDPFNNFCLII